MLPKMQECPTWTWGNCTQRGRITLWSEVTVDMIGPWTTEVGNRKERFSTLTIIDLVTNLVEIVCVTNKTSAAVTAHFVNAWLTHYPKPMSCIHDPGSEFIGWNFQEMLHHNNMQSCCTTTKNPQANAIVSECTNQLVIA
jgi:transposase InsO family protein